jgi:hypothetical protein
VQLEDYLADAVIAGLGGMALRAGLRSGWDGSTRCKAEQFLEDHIHSYAVIRGNGPLSLVILPRPAGGKSG